MNVITLILSQFPEPCKIKTPNKIWFQISSTHYFLNSTVRKATLAFFFHIAFSPLFWDHVQDWEGRVKSDNTLSLGWDALALKLGRWLKLVSLGNQSLKGFAIKMDPLLCRIFLDSFLTLSSPVSWILSHFQDEL